MALKLRGGERHSGDAARLLQGSLLLLAAIAVPVLSRTLAEPTGAMLLESLAVVVLSFLPAWLFLRFVVVRARSVWDEFVLNLHRMGIDRPQFLPEPPRCSLYHEEWERAGGRRRAGCPSIYQQKFEAYYGRGTVQFAGDEACRFRAETLFPVLLATVVFAVGWLVVLDRWPVIITRPELPGDALSFAFMGSYLFVLQMLVRRYFQADLKASAYVSAVVRVVTAEILALVVVAFLIPDSAVATQSAVAFVVGFFPLVGLQAMQKAAALALRTVVPTLRNAYPLSDLDGLSVWYEARLLELGIEDMQNLATANLVDVTLHSRVPVARLIDWVDQAILYLHLEPEPRRRTRDVAGARSVLRRLGIRSATSLEDAGTSAEMPVFCPTVLRTLARETNLDHVRNWKRPWSARSSGRVVTPGGPGDPGPARSEAQLSPAPPSPARTEPGKSLQAAS